MGGGSMESIKIMSYWQAISTPLKPWTQYSSNYIHSYQGTQERGSCWESRPEIGRLSLWTLWNFYRRSCLRVTSKERIEIFVRLSERSWLNKVFLKGLPRETEWLIRNWFWFSPRVGTIFTIFRISLHWFVQPVSVRQRTVVKFEIRS